jgi:exosortase A-associated hydrolase 1
VNFLQHPVIFSCDGDALVGIVSRPREPRSRGVLIVVGGPQYRAGSHRQFTLLANHLAHRGIPAMRFDYRGMGDSTGRWRNFEEVSPDIGAAVDAFFREVHGLREVVIWGLCDAASAALFYAFRDARVSGLALLNPWVRSAATEARAYLRHYYLERLTSAAPWRRLWRGELDLRSSAKSLLGSVRQAMEVGVASSEEDGRGLAPFPVAEEKPLSERMADGLARFGGPVLLILSGNDLTAKEFMDVTQASPRWRRLLAEPRITRRVLEEATHTFSSRAWRDQVAAWTDEWVMSW